MADSNIQVVLTDIGHIQQKEWDSASVQLTYVSARCRPGVTTVPKPDIGDSYSCSGITISGESIFNGATPGLTCKRITETYFSDNHHAGTQYVIYYDTSNNAVNVEPTQDEDTVIMSMNSTAQVDSYQYDPQLDSYKLYASLSGVWEEIKTSQTISVNYVLTNVQTTKRYRTDPITIIEMGAALEGCVNDSEMWGQGIGNILYTGNSVQSIQEVVDEVSVISWNVTNSYIIKHLPGISSNTWEYTFYKGNYSRIAFNPTGTSQMTSYTKAAIPNDLVE